MPAHPPIDLILPNNLAVANFCIESCGVEFLLLLICPVSYIMSWKAKPGYTEHHRPAVERIVNLLPPAWLLPPQSGEIFSSLDHSNRRLRGYAFAEGFDIVRQGGGTKENPSWRFLCIYHGNKTRNTRKLKDKIEVDKDNNITNRRQRD